ncbi:hypothetical protein FRC08_013660 [Ceratobasidium sp. 394]|nr:hypothetical protein FRC08_013660 [Ceratobasidium sp. 394]
MPNLESLRFDIDLRPLPTALEVNLVNNARHRRSRFHTIEANFFGLSDQIRAEDVTSFKCKDAISLAQYLFSMWPNVQIVAQVDEDSESMPEDYETHRKMIKLINDHLAALSCCNRDPSISYEDINILNQGSWNKCFTSA